MLDFMGKDFDSTKEFLRTLRRVAHQGGSQPRVKRATRESA